MNAICLVVDRLHIGCLGAYGNSWIQTPNLDRLASQAVVFDQALIDAPRLETLYRSYWLGWHALYPDVPPESDRSLAEQLSDAAVTTILISDEPQVVRHPLAAAFDESIEIDPVWQAKVARSLEQTHLARCLAQLIRRLESACPPFLLWCHLAGLGTTWDAPLRFRKAYAEEGDPPPPESADVPDYILPPHHDPDELLGVVQSYAGQVMLFDTCLGGLLEFLDGEPLGRETMLVLTSSRGFPLGEHRRVGPCDDALFSELVHVPLMMRLSDGLGAGLRTQCLVEPADLWATLLGWWRIAPPPSPTARSLLPIASQEPVNMRDRLCIRGNETQRAIRTPAWHLRVAEEPELYAKPDDRWELNNVAMRCREISEDLQDAMTQYELSLSSGRVAGFPPLGDVLLRGLE